MQVKADKVRLGDLTASEPLALANLVKQMLNGITTAFNTHTHIATHPNQRTIPARLTGQSRKRRTRPYTVGHRSAL